NGVRDASSEIRERDGGARLWSGDDDRDTGVAARDHAWIEWDAGEQRQADLGRERLAAALAKDRRRLPAVRALEVAHVLDDAEHGDVHALEHLHAAQRVASRDHLRRRDDER